MKTRRQIAIWTSAAAVSLSLLGFVLARQNKEVRSRWAFQLPTTPLAGATLFRDKGCAGCHASSGSGAGLAPSLRGRRSLSGLPEVVTAMWNHAPRMWNEMDANGLSYPTLTRQEMSQLLTFLYLAGYADAPGDPVRGKQYFQARDCGRCHGNNATSGNPGSDLQAIPLKDAEDPLSWAQALWNHASGMENKMKALGIRWPKFQASEMRDLFAYLQSLDNSNQADDPDIEGDPDRGWNLYQQKGCIDCHSLDSQSEGIGRNLGQGGQLPATFSEFGEAMVNHFPEMQGAMRAKHSVPPRFENHDIADIAVFLYGLHNPEPVGSAQIGKTTFAWRGCSRCHGQNGEGTAKAPPLRGRGQTYTAALLATDLWRHGQRMYVDNHSHGQAWPELKASDIGHLLTFLNTSPQP